MPRLETMRLAISEVYPGIGWKVRCSKMPANQVVAIYNSFMRSGRFEKSKPKPDKDGFIYKQMTMFDYGYDFN